MRSAFVAFRVFDVIAGTRLLRDVHPAATDIDTDTGNSSKR